VKPGEYTVTVLYDDDLLTVIGKPTKIRVE
jgi:hypothetical protein